MTQYEYVGVVRGISERFLIPALEALLPMFPFPVPGFHADNGSEYINHRVADLLRKLHVGEFTKSRARRSNDNALVEGKNAHVVRRHLGHEHIPARFADDVDAFARGETIDAHIERIFRLWSGLSRAAAENPHARMREPKTPLEIRTPGPANRPVSFPYTKLMNSNEKVDQGAALILTSTDVARCLGIPRAKWIFPWASTEAHDTYATSHGTTASGECQRPEAVVPWETSGARPPAKPKASAVGHSHRDNLHSAPGLGIADSRCLEMTDLGIADRVLAKEVPRCGT